MDGLREGKGKSTWTDGRVFEGEWKADRKHGKAKYRNENGDEKEETWENGEKKD